MCDWLRCCLTGVKLSSMQRLNTSMTLPRSAPAINSSQADTIPIIWGEPSLFNYLPLFLSVFPIGGEEHVSSLIVGGAGLLPCFIEVEAAACQAEGYFCENPVEKNWSEG